MRNGELTAAPKTVLASLASACAASLFLAPLGCGEAIPDPDVLPPDPDPLPSEAIRQTVRASFGRFRKCYGDGLNRDPKLAGKVNIRFVIAPDGHVSSVRTDGSDIPDRTVVSCVERGFYALRFPEREHRRTEVEYPLTFHPKQAGSKKGAPR